MNIKDFLKSLFIPKYMKRFRYMSALIAICLFILSMYAIVAPVRNYYDRKTHSLVETQDIYYLKSLLNVNKVSEDIEKICEEVNSKDIMSIDGKLVSNNMGFMRLNHDNSITGILERGEERWKFDGVDTEVLVNEEIESPTVTSADGGFYLNGTNVLVSCPGLLQGDELEIINITSTNRSLLKINNETTNILVNETNPVVSIKDGYLYYNDIKTNKAINNDKKVIVNFISNPNQEVYQKTFTSDSDGIVNNFTFTIDLSNLTLNDILKEYSADKYPKIQDEAYYFITITNGFIAYQANPKGIEELAITRNNVKLQTALIATYFSNTSLNLNDLKAENFGSLLTTKLEEGYKVLAVQTFNFTAFIYCVLYTLVISVLFFLLFKRNGKLKTFKEYYNIASITNIIPTIIMFIASWFEPGIFGLVYLPTFAIYYLFVLYRINNSPDLV